MAYEIIEIKDACPTYRMNNGNTFPTREDAIVYMKSILEAPKLGFVGFDWEDDEVNDASDIAAFTKRNIRQFVIQPVN